jgi:hypothetical protein
LGVQVGVCRPGVVNSWFRWSKPPHHVKVNPLGEVIRKDIGPSLDALGGDFFS